MNSKDYQNNFDELYKLFSRTYSIYSTWKGLRKKEFESAYAKNTPFWQATFFSLEQAWLSGIANLFEKSKYSRSGMIVSVYSLLEYQYDSDRKTKLESLLLEYEGILKNVEILRHHALAHNNANYLQKPNEFLGKFPIQYENIDKLFEITGDILSNLNPYKGHGYAYSVLRDQTESSAKNLVERLLRDQNREKAHLEKFKKGEVDSPFLKD